MVVWICKIVFVIGCLCVAVSLLKGNGLHPALEAIRRAREKDMGGSPRPRPAPPKTWKRVVAFILVLIAALCAMAGDVDLKLQTALDRRGFSVGCIDGVWGYKSTMALDAYARSLGIKPFPCRTEDERAAVLQKLYARNFEIPPLLRTVVVDEEAMEAVAGKLPETPAEKAELSDLGYETLLEYYSELGHMSQKAMMRLNPDVEWPNPPPGAKILIPDVKEEAFLSMEERSKLKWPKAERLEIRFGGPSIPSVAAYDSRGSMIAFAPCSIAASREKLPEEGALKVSSMASNPNYTFTPEEWSTQKGKFILPPGPNNPVGRAWIGLSLVGYGLHGTPYPEQVGRSESHGCFRLTNWSAVHFYNLVDVGTPVVIKAEK